VVFRYAGWSVTVMVVFSPPTVSFRGKPTTEELSTSMFSCSSLWKPLATTSTLYVPTGNGWME